MKSIRHLLDVHGIDAPLLAEDIETLIEGRCEAAFNRGVTEGRAAQAMIEAQGREVFIKKLRAEYDERYKQ
jgi:hypothetical protein